MGRDHALKTWPGYYWAMVKGVKTFEVRKNDRDYQVGDLLILEEYCPKTETYSGESVEFEVSYVMEGGEMGVGKGYVVMGLRRI